NTGTNTGTNTYSNPGYSYSEFRIIAGIDYNRWSASGDCLTLVRHPPRRRCFNAGRSRRPPEKQKAVCIK
ncbi:MAG TPA: hypothetical protein VIK22_01710, partial [Candidatus Anoxymicrobiaceae bacterium]